MQFNREEEITAELNMAEYVSDNKSLFLSVIHYASGRKLRSMTG